MKYTKSTVGTTQRREFFIISGLRESFKRGNPIHHASYASEIIDEWNLQRARKGLPYIPGSITEGIYNWVYGSGENATSGLEPRIKFEGHLSNSYLSELPDNEAVAMIEELAKLLAEKLGQEYIEFGYRDRCWSFKAA